MQITTPFATPVGVFDFTPFVEHVRSMFAVTDLQSSPDTHGLCTSIPEYVLDADDISSMGSGAVADALNDALAKAAKAFVEACGWSAEYVPEVRRFWLNEMVSGGSHPAHSHYGSHLSGCFYVDVPEGSGGIVFTNPSIRFDKPIIRQNSFTPFNSVTGLYQPVAGQLFLWESWLQHEVPATTFTGVRRSAAFDITLSMPNGQTA